MQQKFGVLNSGDLADSGSLVHLVDLFNISLAVLTMDSSTLVDLCISDENEESEANDVKKGAKHKAKKHKNVGNRSSNALESRKCKSDVTDQEDSRVDESSLSSASRLSPPPLCRQFWKAGNYEIGLSKASIQNGKNHLRVHPMFLHSNATSHKWAFGAIAELLDNAIDEIQNGATFVVVDKIFNPRDGNPALLIQDDGGGMDPEIIRQCMSFGFSDKKSKSAIGQYGNGFKTSSMRLGADVIVFSRHNKRKLTQSVGLLSYTFLRQTCHDRIVVPVVDYEFNTSTKTLEPLLSHGKENFSINLSMLLQWSPYSTEENLMKQFDEIGTHGTRVIIYNLWLNDDGNMELDFDSDLEDIIIGEAQKLFESSRLSKQITHHHIAYAYQYSLRAYLSILYLRLPQNFRIVLRGKVVEHHNYANDLKFPEFILYRPGGNMEAAIITTIGFLKEAPYVNVHGFNVYHRNRLILPFWRVVKNVGDSCARGVVGLLEANFVEPTHNKQDFEKTSLFQKLEARLKEMTLEYWDFHCGLIGYNQKKHNPPVPVPPQQSLLLDSCLEESALRNHCSTNIDSISHVSARRPEKSTDYEQIEPQQVFGVKRKSRTDANDVQHKPSDQPASGIGNQWQDEETMNLVQENKKLRAQLLELENSEKQLDLKVKQLKGELEDVQHEYKRLLAESEAINMIKEEKT